MRRSRKYTSPPSGRWNPATIRNRVVFPQPEGPRRVKKHPSSMSRETPSTTVVAPNRLTTSTKLRCAATTTPSPRVAAPAPQPGGPKPAR